MYSQLLTAPIGSTLAKLAAPNVIAMFVTLATSMAEAYFVGQLGTASLAGLALAFPMMMLSMMVSAGSMGGAISGAVAQKLGAGDRKAAENIAFHAVLLSVILSVVFSLLFLMGGKAIYSGLGGTGNVLTEALAYSDLFFSGCITMWIATGINGVIRATGKMQVAAFAMSMGSIIQIIMSGLLVFGVGPLPSMGIAGAALGALIGFGCSALFQLWYLTRKSEVLRLHMSGNSVNPHVLADILKVGSLASISPLSSVATIIAITGLVATFGDDALAGYGIGARLEFLMIPLIFGIGSASITMVGAHFGAGAYARGIRIGWVSAFSAAGLSGVVGVLLAMFPGVWADLFTNSEAVRAACRLYLEIVGPFYAFFGLGLCLYFASQGARKLFWPVIGALTRLAVIVIGGWYLDVQGNATIADFFILISLAMTAYGIMTAGAIRLGAWTVGISAKQAKLDT